MTTRRAFRLRTLLWLALLLGGARLGAQGLGLAVTSLPSTPVVNSSITFRLSLTNTSGVALTNVTVVNTLPPSLTFQSATAEFSTVTNIGRIVTFTRDFLTNNEATTFSVVALPTAFGTFTNLTVVLATNLVAGTNVLAATNAHAFTVNSAAVDLAVGLTGFASGVLSNDLTSYTLTATNFGTSAVSDVVISNLLPAGVQFLSIAPSNATVGFTSNRLTITLPSFGGGSVTNYRVNIQPTSAGTFVFSAGITAPGLLDTNTANNSATATLPVSGFLTGQLVAIFVSAQVYNPQTGLMQQTINLSNIGDTPVASARIMVIGLTNWLFNAVGTNSGSPYVTYANTLAAGADVDLVLEYFVPTRLPVANLTNLTLLALEVPAVHASASAGAGPAIRQLLILAPGRVLVEFDSVAGRTYTVDYGDTVAITNAAQPSITATGNRTQWIDNGPPKTISAPGASRFYRVRQNP